MNGKFRWRLAGVLNRLPWTCWADLVSWAIDGRRDQLADALKPASGCRAEGKEASCWCAKNCTDEFRRAYLAPAKRT